MLCKAVDNDTLRIKFSFSSTKELDGQLLLLRIPCYQQFAMIELNRCRTVCHANVLQRNKEIFCFIFQFNYDNRSNSCMTSDGCNRIRINNKLYFSSYCLWSSFFSVIKMTFKNYFSSFGFKRSCFTNPFPQTTIPHRLGFDRISCTNRL